MQKYIAVFSCFLLSSTAYAAQVKDVNVVNTPTVNVANLPDVNVANTVDVEVVNADPVAVQIVENFPRLPFQSQQQSSPATAISVVHTYQVPMGFTLVIESFSARVTLPSSQFLFGSNISTTTSGQTAQHHFALPEVGNCCNSRFYRGMHAMRLYADSGTNVQIVISKQDVFTGTLTVSTSISGYLVPEDATSLQP